MQASLPIHRNPSRIRNDGQGRKRLVADAAGQLGFTLVELLLGMTLAIVVFTAITGLLIDGLHDQTTMENRSYQLQRAEVAIQQLVRNLREATSVTLLSSSSITYSEPVATGVESIAFSCSGTTDTCTQTIAGVPKTAVTNVTNSNIFTASPSSNPTYVGITLSVSAPAENAITVTDGTGLRNVTLGT
jgi:type II secretory pathway pseudopilin PulG